MRELSRLPFDETAAPAVDICEELRQFRWQGRATTLASTTVVANGCALEVPTYVNEFWTSKQRAANSLHEISYRACFKPQLPRFFIERLTRPKAVVYDPFMGRGTTVIEAALLGRVPAGADVNPLSVVLTRPRLAPPRLADVAARLGSIDLSGARGGAPDLAVFYHPDTLREIASLRGYLLERGDALDDLDRWIRLVAVNRLTGHSKGFFSVYTLPPNQAASVEAQRKINEARQQTPPRRSVGEIILRKTKSLLRDVDDDLRHRLAEVAGEARLLTGSASATASLASGSVDLVVTSPPFLDVVDYAADNWLRCWFCGIEADAISITIARRLEQWREAMTAVFAELARVVRPGGHVAFEVGEVRGGRINLEEAVLLCGHVTRFEPLAVVINSQTFTKTSNAWGVANNRQGTNTNRIVLFRRP